MSYPLYMPFCLVLTRYWIVAGLSWLIATILAMLFGYIAFNLANTYPATSLTTIADTSSVLRTHWDVKEAARVASVARALDSARSANSTNTSAHCDYSDDDDAADGGAVDDRSIANAYQVPLSVVNRILYNLPPEQQTARNHSASASQQSTKTLIVSSHTALCDSAQRFVDDNAQDMCVGVTTRAKSSRGKATAVTSVSKTS